MKQLKKAIEWRINYYHQQSLKLFWDLKRLFDFSKKEKVNAISVIVVGRNDNYGGDFSERLRTTLDWNLSILPNPELIYVEWNQVPDRPSDCDWISTRYPNSKCYIVPKEIHDTITQNPKMPVMEYFGKNVGIRRATNNWVLLLNADIYIDPKDFVNLNLSKRHIYGTYFGNVEWDGKEITREKYKKTIKSISHPTKTLTSLVGNFILTHKNNWLLATGYDEYLTNSRLGVDNDGLYQLESFGLKPMILGTHYHLDHPESANKGNNPTHGDSNILENRTFPYKNHSNWGLIDYPLEKIAQSIWKIVAVSNKK
ncbi:MAG: hypothetical protein WCX31_04285 [Salinivirgaceae bacterium]|jgi:hypothetical protein